MAFDLLMRLSYEIARFLKPVAGPGFDLRGGGGVNIVMAGRKALTVLTVDV